MVDMAAAVCKKTDQAGALGRLGRTKGPCRAGRTFSRDMYQTPPRLQSLFENPFSVQAV